MQLGKVSWSNPELSDVVTIPSHLILGISGLYLLWLPQVIRLPALTRVVGISTLVLMFV